MVVSVLILVAQTDSMTRLVIELLGLSSGYRMILINLRRILCNKMGRKSGKDRFRCTNSTVICNLHFKPEDIIRVAGGGRNRLVSGAVPMRWNETVSSRNPKSKSQLPVK